MAMNRFTQAYDRAKAAMQGFEFPEKWKFKLDGLANIKGVVGSDDGPKLTDGRKLDVLRMALGAETVKGASEGKVLLDMAGVSSKRILGMKDSESDAVATLKMLRHFYLVRDAGAQSVWVYAQPFSFHKWVFDEMKNRSGWMAARKLNKVDEVYTKQERKHMAAGVSKSTAWAQKCVAKLTNPNQETKALVKTWFCDDGFTGSEDAAAATLKAGFKKMGALLGSNKLIFSDEPIDRMKGDKIKGQKHYKSNWNDYAFVDGGVRERLDVVYIQNATLKKWGSADEGWMATLAIIHELSHRVLDTKDVVYDFTGLKPSDKLTFEHAMKNADSWAYFAADLNGELTETVRDRYYKSPAKLRDRYLASLNS